LKRIRGRVINTLEVVLTLLLVSETEGMETGEADVMSTTIITIVVVMMMAMEGEEEEAGAGALLVVKVDLLLDPLPTPNHQSNIMVQVMEVEEMMSHSHLLNNNNVEGVQDQEAEAEVLQLVVVKGEEMTPLMIVVPRGWRWNMKNSPPVSEHMSLSSLQRDDEKDIVQLHYHLLLFFFYIQTWLISLLAIATATCLLCLAGWDVDWEALSACCNRFQG